MQKEQDKYERYNRYIKGWKLGAFGKSIPFDGKDDYDIKVGYSDGKRAYDEVVKKTIRYYLNR